MTLEEFLSHARNFSRLGDAVGDQLERVAEDDSSVADQNPNALNLAAKRFLVPLYRDLREEIADDDDTSGLAELRDCVKDVLDVIEYPVSSKPRLGRRVR